MTATPSQPVAGRFTAESPTSSEAIERKCLIMIFGASGDLTSRKLVPALFNLYKEKRIGEHVAVMGISRTKFSDEEFRKKVTTSSRRGTTRTPSFGRSSASGCTITPRTRRTPTIGAASASGPAN